ncbi:hypothetical protein ETN89_19895 (plasmid) [Photobacterium damselae subsp. damselae]|uniref:hypothetical protein n=1 Tax=Photobacterium damselae TaxID=38293 RepID=UPI000A2FF1DD|nr:hypothetical protein [Photobacterium damselae]ARR51919.1 hypothetical protein CAY62_21185 [Photobacterium damselae subsp. damselae]QAY37527.1 hypothetical protein ETN89_19895 [Photobacterium damselae subsp. damselae]
MQNIKNQLQRLVILNKNNKIITDLNVNYLALLVKLNNNNGIMYHSNNHEWANLYYQDLIMDCPLVEVGKKIGVGAMIWECVPVISRAHKNVVYHREGFNINNGISFLSKNEMYQSSIAIGTDIKNYDFLAEILEKKNELNSFLMSIDDEISRAVEQTFSSKTISNRELHL